MRIETMTSFPSLFPVDLRQQRGKTIPLLGDFHEGGGGVYEKEITQKWRPLLGGGVLLHW